MPHEHEILVLFWAQTAYAFYTVTCILDMHYFQIHLGTCMYQLNQPVHMHDTCSSLIIVSVKVDHHYKY